VLLAQGRWRGRFVGHGPMRTITSFKLGSPQMFQEPSFTRIQEDTIGRRRPRSRRSRVTLNETEGPANQVAAALLTVVLQSVSAFQPATQQ